MSAGCVKWVLSHAVRTACGGSPAYWTPASRFPICSGRCNIIAASWRWSPFCTEKQDTNQTPAPKKIKQASFTSVGRRIPYRDIQVISKAGENLGTMHRSDAIRIMDQGGLKLVLLSEKKDPPVYRLMSGKEIHEERLKQLEKKKGKAAAVQMKELNFSAGISSHDLSFKLKQVESWLEKKCHVRINLRCGRGGPKDSLDTTLEQMVAQMEVMVGFVSKPKVVRDGQVAMCIVRPPSAKELREKDKAAESQSVDSASKATESKTSPASSTDTTEGSIQQ